MINAWSGGTPDAMPLFRPLAIDRRHRSFGLRGFASRRSPVRSRYVPSPTTRLGMQGRGSKTVLHSESLTPFQRQNGRSLASRRARIASSESRARCPYVAHLAQVGVAHEGVDVTTGKRPKMLMVVGNPTPRMNELYGAARGEAVRDRGRRRRDMVVRAKRDDFSMESDRGVAVLVREVRETTARSGASVVRVHGARVLGLASSRMHRSPKISPMQVTARSSWTRVAMEGLEGGA